MIRFLGGVPSQNAGQVLFVLRNADMTLTTDQTFTKLFSGTNYRVVNVVANRKTGAFGVACAGGIYTAAAKGGNAIIAAGQSWAALTGANTVQGATLNTAVTDALLTSTTPILSLTTGNTGALTADLFIYGYPID